jgi:class 3 adenylate cyclase/predicted ATPase
MAVPRMVELTSWLESHGLGRYAQLLADNAIGIDILADLTEEDLEKLSLPLGDRKRLLRAAAALATTPQDRQRPTSRTVHEGATQRAEPQRRQLTILFCDLVGSTGLSTRFDPEDMREIIKAYQSACARQITRYEGWVAKYMGDGILAYFGWPIAHENDAERAVRAGLAVTTAVAKLITPSGEPLAARVGIATGVVVVGDVVGTGSSREEAVVGETPNLAARLQALAAPGSVVISDPTRRLTRELFRCLDLGEQQLAGFEKPLRCWQATAVGNTRSRFVAMHALDLLPIVGREEDLEKLRSRWVRAKESFGQVVLVCGEPGIGKSRIVESLQHQLDDEHSSLHYHCSPFHKDTALYPLISQLELAADIRRNDGPGEKLEKLRNRTSQFSTDPVDVALLAALLSLPTHDHLPPLTLTPEKQKARILETFTKELSSLAARNPVLIVFEDAHWADPTTLEYLSSVITLIRRIPVLLVVTFRPDFTAPWSSGESVATLTLHRLDRPAGSALISQVAQKKSLPAEIIDEILAKSDGVPLYIEELTKAVLGSEFLVQKDDAFVLSGQLVGFVVPSSLHDSLMARLDRLGPVKEVAQVAATLGRTFSMELLEAISPLEAADTKTAVSQLVNAGLLQARQGELEEVYEFKHALIRDVAYQSLLRATRRAHHQRIAATIEARFPQIAEKEPEYLAHHFTEAQLVTKAIQYWQVAGNRAKQRSANLEAIAHYSKALGLTASLPEASRDSIERSLRVALGPALMATKGGASRDVQENYARARELAERADVGREMFPVLFGLFRYYVLRAELQTAASLAMQLLDLARSEKDSGLLIEGSLAMGAAVFWMGDTATAAKHFSDALNTYSPSVHSSHSLLYGQDPFLIATSYLALSDWTLGYADRAVETIGRALARGQETGHLFSRAYALYGAAWVHQLRGEPRECLAWAEKCLELSSDQGFRYFMGLGAAAKGWAEIQQGNAIEGLARVQDGVAAWSATGALASFTYHHSLLADACLKAGKAQEGLDVVRGALNTVLQTGERCWEAELHRIKGEILLKLQGGGEEAEKCLHDALHAARARQCRGFEIRAATSLARLWYRSGRRAEARAVLEPTYRAFTEGFDTADLRKAAALLDEIS